MRFNVLGPFGVFDDDGAPVDVGPPKLRLLTAVLLCREGLTGAETLVGDLWGAPRRGHGTGNLRVYVHHLRRLLGAHRIRQHNGGYEIVRHPGEFDAESFRTLAAQGRQLAAAGQPVEAAQRLRAALALWRGPAFGEVVEAQVVQVKAAALQDLRLDTYEACFDIELALGRHPEVCAELRGVSAAEPLREGLRAQLMLALGRSGRQAEALAAYEETRRLLADELGLDPGPRLQQAHQLVLRGVPQPEPIEIRAGVGDAAEHPAGGEHGEAGPAGDGSRADWGPVVPPAQLPGRPRRFVGREHEFAMLDQLTRTADGGAPTVVVGPAGVGKTALAVHWAHAMTHRYPDGQFFVDLRGFGAEAPRAPAEVLWQILHALGVPAASIPVDPDARAALFRSAVADRRLLLMLDDAASSQQVRPLLPGGRATVVVTSRQRLDGLMAREDAAVISVPPLTHDESRVLLAGAAGLDERADAVATLARLCGGLPLAVRIAAARLAAGALTPEELIEQLSDEAGRLSALSVEDGDTAVRAALTVSYRTLDAPVARLFRLLGLHGRVQPSTAACAALAGASVVAVCGHLDVLLEGHLLMKAGPGRYAIHDLVRLYAGERAETEDPPADRAAALRRGFAWYLYAAAAAAGATQPHVPRFPYPAAEPAQELPEFATAAAAVAWADEELPNLTAMLDTVRRTGWVDATWQLAHAITPLCGLRADLHIWIDVSKIGLEAAGADPAVEMTWFFGNSLGIAHAMLRQFDVAERHFEEALAAARSGSDIDRVVPVLANLATLLGETGRVGAAVELLREVLAISTERGLRWRIGSTRNSLCASLLLLGRYTECVETASVALAEANEHGDLRSAAYACSHLGEASTALGRHGEALTYFGEARRTARECGARAMEAQALLSLGDELARLGRTGEAHDCWQQAVGHFRALGLPEADSAAARLAGASAPP
jgi:DNA-binding SARP family transcriptional activator